MAQANIKGDKPRMRTSYCPECGGELKELTRDFLPTQKGDPVTPSTKTVYSVPAGYECSSCGAIFDRKPESKTIPPPKDHSTHPKPKRRSTTPPKRS